MVRSRRLAGCQDKGTDETAENLFDTTKCAEQACKETSTSVIIYRISRSLNLPNISRLLDSPLIY